jgi:hypothetical protein
MPSPPDCSEVTVGKGRLTHGKESLHRGMEPSPGAGSGRGVSKGGGLDNTGSGFPGAGRGAGEEVAWWKPIGTGLRSR